MNCQLWTESSCDATMKRGSIAWSLQRYVLHALSANYITAKITCGEYSENILFILHIPLSPTHTDLPFTLHRRQTQFAVQLVFAMTINKAQVPVLVFYWTSQCSLTDNCTSRHPVAVTQATSVFLYSAARLITASKVMTHRGAWVWYQWCIHDVVARDHCRPTGRWNCIMFVQILPAGWYKRKKASNTFW